MTDYDELAERLTSLNFNEDQKAFFLQILEGKQTAEKALQEEAEARQRADKALQEEAEARQRAETKLTEIELNSIWQYFLPHGKRLPQLRQTGTKSGGAINIMHNPIKNFYSREFGIIPLTETCLQHCKSVSASIQFTDFVGYSTEMDIQQLCKSFLENMIVASKVGLELRSDLSISELRADFWVISSNGFPVGAIEVKKPDSEDSGEEKKKMHLGQLFDYLMRIRTFHGVRNLIGILTDFESWTICWPKDSEQLAKATNDIDPGNAIDPTTPESREIYVSQSYGAQENTLAYAIVSALRKMKSSGERVDHVDLLSSSRSYIQLGNGYVVQCNRNTIGLYSNQCRW